MIDTKAIINTSGRIKDAIALKRAELDIVYGRRRIGKNTIIVNAVSRKGDLYFETLQNVSL